MVTAVVGHPDDLRALHATWHAAASAILSLKLKRTVGFERAVGEVTVDADRDAEAGPT